ncbi:MAG: putative baseplate assembly protein [Cyanobacteria bacterium J06648_10]
MRYFCNNQQRRQLVRDTTIDNPDGSKAPKLNGIDYLEVTEDQKTLVLYFFHSLSKQGDDSSVIAPHNIKITGGTRIQNIRAIALTPIQPNALQITLNQWGDFSTYRLQLVTSSENSQPPTGTTPPLDAPLSQISFSFKVDCPSPFDCPKPADCSPPSYSPPHIDYLAKDYASFRQLMLDRLSVTLPQWTERNPADVGVALVEVLAYAADHLSYYQDAAATEAYLGTARKRASVRRHARLLNYPMHEGCNARTWVQVQTDTDNLLIPTGTVFLTRVAGKPARLIPQSQSHQEALQQQPEGFASMHPLRVFKGHSKISFYTWGNEDCCLPKGATKATLKDNLENRLHLSPGDVLVFEETISTTTLRTEDADISHRWAVRLTKVSPEAIIGNENDEQPSSATSIRSLNNPQLDPLTEQPIVEIQWDLEDALPFALQLSQQKDGILLEDMAIARGNIVLADHGLAPSAPQIIPNTVSFGKSYRPRLDHTNITYATPLGWLKPNDDVEFPRSVRTTPRLPSATASIRQNPQEALPDVTLLQAEGSTWQPVRDLLNSDRFDEKFVVEPDETRRATLRFGDNVSGQAPLENSQFTARYRVGNGRAGNIGAEAIAHIVSDTLASVTAVSNRLPGSGGTEPEPITQVKLDAPQAFRVQQRAVTAEDYATVAVRHPEVQQSRATRRWTGSWYTYFVTVDRKGGRPIDTNFEQKFRTFLEHYRLAGYDLEIDAPQFVPLDIRFRVCTQPGYFAGDVEAALLKTFSNRDWPDGRRGFFHPDNFTFGQSVYLSQVIAKAMSIPGVQWIDVGNSVFKRWGRAENREREQGEITFDRLEIARLDNNANAPENGRIEFVVEGGR